MKRSTKSNNINKQGPRLRKLRKIFLNRNYHRLRSSPESAMLCLSSPHKNVKAAPPPLDKCYKAAPLEISLQAPLTFKPSLITAYRYIKI